MRNTIKIFIIISMFLAMGIKSAAQVTINGSTCVVPGTVYQYTISGSWDSVSTMQVCVTGGAFVDSGMGSKCTHKAYPLASVMVIWSTTTSSSLSIQSSLGNATLNVNVTSPLLAGTIDPLSKVQSFYDTLSTPSVIHCSLEKGGSCSPSYSYQWQESFDGLIWRDISGSTSQHLLFSNAVKQASFFRRKVTETTSNTIGYSDMAVVNVLVTAQVVQQ
jgi:hypothetical protein